MKINVIREQIVSTKVKTDKLLSDIAANDWLKTPKGIESNINWHIGHILLANYLHGVASISGASEEVNKLMNVADYIKFYGLKSNPIAFESEKPSTEKLLKIYELMLSLTLKNLETLTEANLDEATAIPNPAAKTKYEALKWLPLHQSWHNGQIAILRRILNN